MKISETKKFVNIFAGHFGFLKNILVKPFQDLFSFLQKRLFKFPSSED
jgi:hypothetical protein